jgi:hypothetical protein
LPRLNTKLILNAAHISHTSAVLTCTSLSIAALCVIVTLLSPQYSGDS